jgi:hypothetical protein
MNMPVSVRVTLAVLAVLFVILPETAKAVIFTIGLLLWGFFGWRGSMRRRQLVSGTPTSKVASAAKGYAEFRGRARNALPIPLYDPITKTACVWYHVETEKFDFGKWRWRTVGSAQSGRPFALEDETGLCLVLPGDARLLTRPPERVKERLTLRHNIRRILDGEHLYAIGHLERIDVGPEAERPAKQPSFAPDFERRVAELMRDWKRDPIKRAKIFDPNRDGQTDDSEMTTARELARTEVARRMGAEATSVQGVAAAAAAALGGLQYAVGDRKVTHWLRKPDDERDYILSSRPEAGVLSHEGRAGLGYLLLFILVAIGSLVVLAGWLGAFER